MMTLGQIASAIPGAKVLGDPSLEFLTVSTDTRSLPEGCLFFALRGERYDAHDFLDQAIQGGAIAIVIETPSMAKISQIIVPDTKVALGLAAAAWRSQFEHPVIAVTGSNGKTTVTQMIASILRAEVGDQGYLATRGNLNNDIGVPLTLFRMQQQHRFSVVELGMNHPGEIEYLAQLVRPTVALINNAQREHQEYLGSVEATAHENGQVITMLEKAGVAVFPSDDECVETWRSLACGRKVMDFGFKKKAQIRGSYTANPLGMELKANIQGTEININLYLYGSHNAHNALAAATSAYAAGISIASIKEGLESFSPVKGRCVPRTTLSGSLLIDDTYNANPDSVIAAIDLLSSLDGERVLILGDMGEVGQRGSEFHKEIGAYAKSMGIDLFLALGELSRNSISSFNQNGTKLGIHFESIEPLIDCINSLSKQNSTILVKGSRFMKMERIVKSLCETVTDEDLH